MNRPNELKERMKRLAQKGIRIGLCAALAGSLTTGALYGAKAVSGVSPVSTVSAAEQEFTLLTADKEKDEDKEKAAETEEAERARGYLDVSDVVEKAMPSIVSITTKSIEEVEDYYNYYFGFGGYAPQEKEVEGGGSGIILAKNESELLIVTNYHVVADATTLTVTFIDGETYEAKTKGFDSAKDLAVVSVPISDLEEETISSICAATVGSSDDLRIGEQVIAIGDAMGYGQSVTTGIVSAKNRRIDADLAAYSTTKKDGVNLIQTDAAINPGNSGGALLNMDGEVVGINSAKLASTDVEGMGYSIAISDVSDILVELMNTTSREKIESGKHGVLGITGQSVSEEMSQLYDVPEGVFVLEVSEDSGAMQAGIKTKSIITKFDGRRVRTIDELVELLLCYEPGEVVDVTLQVMGEDGYQEQVFTVTLGESTETVEEKTATEKVEKEKNEDYGRKEERDQREDDEEDYEDYFGEYDEDDEDGYSSATPDDGFENRIPDFSDFFRY